MVVRLRSAENTAVSLPQPIQIDAVLRTPGWDYGLLAALPILEVVFNPSLTSMSSIPELNGTLGATEIASVVGAFLLGMLTLQVWNYYRRSSADSFLLRCTVALVWWISLLELGHTVAAWHAGYLQTVTFYGQPQHISSPPRSGVLTILLAALVVAVVQSFFANRIRILSGSWTIMLIICSLNTLRFMANMGSLGLVLHFSRISIIFEYRWLVMTALSLGLAVDFLITASVCYFLRHMGACASKRSRTIVDTLIAWSIVHDADRSILKLNACFSLWGNLTITQSLNGRKRLHRDDDEPTAVIHFAPVRASTEKEVMLYGRSVVHPIYGPVDRDLFRVRLLAGQNLSLLGTWSITLISRPGYRIPVKPKDHRGLWKRFDTRQLLRQYVTVFRS
ncbi:hypothetical protein DFH07DRAFT_781211 [Mycena maculata]|uniref:Uncharacterized protein n=1 Tax=Mycena maculata TaxID=230809 RepID=A0AAD7MTQ0_9AGAR|nr:hypothetical protein DFH07DRAFT_781211 [Mycena maculata]